MTEIITFVIISLSFTAGYLIASVKLEQAQGVKDFFKKTGKRLHRRLNKPPMGGIRSPSPKQVKIMKDREFSKNFPQV